jgi:hypothetical protein
MASAIDIDEIVRAVLRQLQGEPQGTIAAPAPNRTLELTDKLVTLATLENRLTGIDQLALRAGAVVTPAALDELRSRGIEVVRVVAPIAAAAVRPTLTIGVAEVTNGACDVPALIAAFAKTGCAVERIAETGLTSVTAELTELSSKGGRPVVLLTSRPAAAVCIANRCRGVRAVGGRDSRGVLESILEVAANFVAIDPASLSAFELRRLVTEFVANWPRALPNGLE